MNFNKIKKLGEGKDGSVFIAIHDGNTILLKEGSKQSIIKEVDSYKKLTYHKNISSFLNHKISDDESYIIREYHDGNTLRSLIGSITKDDAINFALQILSAIDHIHMHDIIHGDLKPENIIVSDNIIKLYDFGCSKSIEQLHNSIITDSIQGTSCYIAPEVYDGIISHQNDIYAFGIIFFELLVGRKPTISDRIINTQLNKIYTQCVAPINNRYKSASVIITDLKRLIEINSKIQSKIEFVNINTNEISIDEYNSNYYLNINNQNYKIGESFIESFFRLTKVPQNILPLDIVFNNFLSSYQELTILIDNHEEEVKSIFPSNILYFGFDTAKKIEIVLQALSEIIICNHDILYSEYLTTSNSNLIFNNHWRIGSYFQLPRDGRNNIKLSYVLANDNNIIILSEPLTTTTYKLENTEFDDFIARFIVELKLSAKSMNDYLSDTIEKCLADTKTTKASFQELIDTANQIIKHTGDWKLTSNLKVPEILNKYKLKTTTDKPIQWRKTANTPFTRYQLIELLSKIGKSKNSISLMQHAGKLLLSDGDLSNIATHAYSK